jgi:hypothetical protein
MSRYKVLKSVAHNIGHSFTSLMNYSGDDYVMGHILRLARKTGCDTFKIDFVSGEGGPPALLVDPISEIPERYTRFFWDLVSRQGSDRSLVKSATLTLHYDLTLQRPLFRDPDVIESPYVCEVLVTDCRGKDYVAQFKAWWYPERLEPLKEKARPWWKFWSKTGR